MTAVNEERLEYTLTLTPTMASAFLESLNRRLAALRDAQRQETDPKALAEAVREGEALIAVMMAWERAIRAPGAARGVVSLFGASKLPALERAEADARGALNRAMENLAKANAAFAASISTGGETGPAETSQAVSAGQVELDRAKSAYDVAAGRVRQEKGREAEERRMAAYAQSQRAHDEAIAALRKYEPLVLEMLKLFSVLTLHSDLALGDVEAADKARTDPRMAKAIAHLEAALDAQRHDHAEAVTKHVTEALHQLKLATEWQERPPFV